MDLAKIGSFTFKEIDAKRFPLFYLTKQAYAMGNCALIVLNIANEVAVKAYLERKIGFLDINKIIENALQKIEQTQISSVEDVINYSETYALYCSKSAFEQDRLHY